MNENSDPSLFFYDCIIFPVPFSSVYFTQIHMQTFPLFSQINLISLILFFLKNLSFFFSLFSLLGDHWVLLFCLYFFYFLKFNFCSWFFEPLVQSSSSFSFDFLVNFVADIFLKPIFFLCFIKGIILGSSFFHDFNWVFHYTYSSIFRWIMKINVIHKFLLFELRWYLNIFILALLSFSTFSLFFHQCMSLILTFSCNFESLWFPFFFDYLVLCYCLHWFIVYGNFHLILFLLSIFLLAKIFTHPCICSWENFWCVLYFGHYVVLLMMHLVGKCFSVGIIWLCNIYYWYYQSK